MTKRIRQVTALLAVQVMMGLPAILLWTSFQYNGTGKGDVVSYGGNEYQVYVVNLRYDSVAMFHKNEQGEKIYGFDRLKSHLEAEGRDLLFATNGGMFTPDHEPVGLYIEESRIINPIDTESGAGNFYLLPNGIFSINQRNTGAVQTTQSYLKKDPYPKYATQSGPMLVIDGKLHPAFRKGSENKYIRSGVGQIGVNSFVFAISTRPVNFYDFGEFFRDYYNCSNALYLDGAISGMYIKENPEAASVPLSKFGVLIGHFR